MITKFNRCEFRSILHFEPFLNEKNKQRNNLQNKCTNFQTALYWIASKIRLNLLILAESLAAMSLMVHFDLSLCFMPLSIHFHAVLCFVCHPFILYVFVVSARLLFRASARDPIKLHILFQSK